MDVYKAPYAQSAERIADWRFEGQVPNLLEVIDNGHVTILVGLSGQAGAFNQPIVEAVSRNTSRPVIFPLSNPTSICEALPEDILLWTEGRAIVATGSPFEDVVYGDKTFAIGQGNNAFVFPGIGFAAILSEASRITDAMVLESAYALADYTAAAHMESGRVYPPVKELQEVSVRVTNRVMTRAIEEGVAQRQELERRDLDTYIRQHFWKPRYLPFVRASENS